jgi:large subunit ribosomal protein L22
MADAPTVHARAIARYIPVSPTKVRPVLSLIRGLGVEDAERALQICPRSAADDVFKLLESAIANAENTRQLPPDELYVCGCWADEGPTRKWGRPRARGRYAKVRKRSTHITIELGRFSSDELEARRGSEERKGGSATEQRRRRAERVARSRAAKQERREAEHEDHDHDHEDHDHDHDEELLETQEPAVEEDESTVSEELDDTVADAVASDEAGEAGEDA